MIKHTNGKIQEKFVSCDGQFSVRRLDVICFLSHKAHSWLSLDHYILYNWLKALTDKTDVQFL